MPSSDGDGLRAAIVAQPDDDIVRLIYADWLQENGQPARAQFIRVQVAAAQAEPFSPQALKEEKTAAGLLDANPHWRRALLKRAIRVEFARGFAERVYVDAAVFPRDAESLFAEEPVRAIQVMRYAGSVPVSLAPFFETPQLQQVARLDVTDLRMAPDEFALLSGSPHLMNLTDLCLRGNAVPPDWLSDLLTDPVGPPLTGLDVFDLSHLGPRLALLFPSLLHRFKRLNIGHIRFSSQEIQRVLNSQCLKEIEELRIGWFASAAQEGALSHVNPGFVIPWNHLRLLDLSGQRLGDEGASEIVKELCRRKEPSPLRWLSLAGTRLGADGVRALVRSDESKVRLFRLDVSLNGLSASQGHALIKRFPEAVVTH